MSAVEELQDMPADELKDAGAEMSAVEELKDADAEMSAVEESKDVGERVGQLRLLI